MGILAHRSKRANRSLPRGDRAGRVGAPRRLPRDERGGGAMVTRGGFRTQRRGSRAATDTGGRARPRPRFGRGRGRGRKPDHGLGARWRYRLDDESFAVGPAGRPPSRREGAPGVFAGRPFASCRCPRNFSSARRRVCSRRRGRECEGGGVWRRDARLARRRVQDVGPRPSRTRSPRRCRTARRTRTRTIRIRGWWIRKTTVVSRRSPTASPGSERGRARPRDERERAGRTGRGHRAAHGGDHGEGVERTSGARRRETMARTRVGLALGVSLGDSQPLAAEGGVFSGRFTRGDARVARVVEGRAEGGTKRVDGGEADGTGSTKGDAPHGRTRHARRWWVPTGGRIVSTVRPRRRARRHRRRSSSTAPGCVGTGEHLFTEKFSRASRRLWRPSRKSPGRRRGCRRRGPGWAGTTRPWDTRRRRGGR